MVNDWEAIEKYLIAKEQEVPQMVADLSSMIHEDSVTEPSTSTEFYGDDIALNKPVPVEVCSFNDQFQKLDSQELYNLDQYSHNSSSCSSDSELYQYFHGPYQFEEVTRNPEHETVYNNNNTTTNNNNNNIDLAHVHVKQESFCSPSLQEETDFFTPDAKEDLHYKMWNWCHREVEDVCRFLRISPDPRQWSCEQVREWISWQCQQAGLPQPSIETFYMLGAQLCQLSEDKFHELAPGCADHLTAKLDIWLNVMQHTSYNYAPQVTHIPVPLSPRLPSSPECNSPISNHGDEECTAASPRAATFDFDRLPEERLSHHRQTIQLWQFLKLLLEDGGYTACIRWVDQSRGIFKIENSSRVAKLWGKRKNRPAMNYDKLSRSIRQYYKKGIIKKTEHSKRLVYQFCK
ncbi:ETS-related transcription factor Elf-5-like isoform X1 [Mya arenaria]|uniref:ETS-related transcription factor Elf-5-like isoform X1 n=1 Tax=Mya arenaria TaxID=6604 RepID=UPI0022E1DD3E|nr:ETS-related transcription factor Elf-5-like isoform X1 [Mya arenaria]